MLTVKNVKSEGYARCENIMIIGLTGSYGSGKTTVAEMFQTLGARIIDADIIARDIVEPSLPAYHDIVEEFGKEVVCDDGTLNRRKIREIIFNDAEKRKRLNQITHPRIRQEEYALLEKWKHEPLVVFNVALLFENNLAPRVDVTVVVTVSDEKRIERLKKRDNRGADSIRKVLDAQMPEHEKIKRADFIIDNNGTFEETFHQVRSLAQQFAAQGNEQTL